MPKQQKEKVNGSDGGDESAIGELTKQLYSRGGFKRPPVRPAPLSQHNLSAEHDWQDKNELEKIKSQSPQTEKGLGRNSMSKKIFIVSLVFFALATVISLVIFFRGTNTISATQVGIEIQGPVSSAGGDKLAFEVSVRNTNRVPLNSADLLIEYPEGTRQDGNIQSELKRYREALGTIEQGKSVAKKVGAVLFGEEGEVKKILVSVEYRVPGSNAIFHKEKEYEVAISSSPIILSLNLPSEIATNQEFEFPVEIASNSSALMEGVMLRAEYPFGFSFVSADPKPSWGNTVWSFGDLKPGAKRKIKIKGKVLGLDEEERTFKFSVGIKNPKDERTLGTVFLFETKTIAIKKPFIGLTLSLDGVASESFSVKSGKIIRADIAWANDTGGELVDATIEAKFSGVALDRSSISSDNAFFRSVDNTLLWDESRNKDFSAIAPGKNGTVSFSFSAITPLSSSGTSKNQNIMIEVSMKARRLTEESGPELISSSIARTVKLLTSLGLSANATYWNGPVTNTGPIPPKAETPTTYTIVWTLTNTSNNISQARVSASLPPYVKWLNVISPENESVSYNPLGGEITWDAGEIKAGAGFESPAREVAFQISFTPGIGQIGFIPTLIGEITATGEDTFANTSLRVIRTPLTTELLTDPNYRDGMGTVVK